MFSLFKMPKKKTFGHFLTSSEDKLFFVKKEDMFSKKGTYMVSLSKPDINDGQIALSFSSKQVQYEKTWERKRNK